MFLIRFGVLAIFLVMLLPTGPHGARSSGPGVGSGDFCDRYPHTCAASVELLTAFQLKLAYGVTLARQTLGSPSGIDGYLGLPSAERKLSGRVGEWQSSQSRSGRDTFADSNSARDGRSTEWRRD